MTKAKTWQKGLSVFDNPVTVNEYAKEKNITIAYVQRLCRLGKLKCAKVSRVWFIEDTPKK